MKAITLRDFGGPEMMRLSEVEKPSPAEGQILIKVMNSSVNRPDIIQREGNYPPPPGDSEILGLEVAGVVESNGNDATRFKPGDRVVALVGGGGYAEYCCVNEGHCLAVPPKLSLIEAAAVPETFFTVWYNVFMRCRLKKGETFLVHGGSSGIGTTAIQLAKARGCKVITTAGSNEKCRFCEKLGADKAINYRTEDWQRVVRDTTDGRGVDVLLDMVAGPYMQKNMDSMALEGRYAIIAFLQGPTAELNMRVVLGRRLTVTGSTLRPQSIDEKSLIANQVENNILPLLESGEVGPIIDSTFSMNDVAAAHELMESSRHKGKLVLVIGQS